MSRPAAALAAFTAVVGFLLGLVAATGESGPAAATSALRHPQPPPVVVSAVPPAPAAANGATVDFASVAARVNAAVVNVDAAVRGTGRGRTGPRWRREMGDDPNAPREGSGSGFLIDTAGYLLTNYHVVEGADRLTVTLVDGRSFKAELVGVDPAIDVALLKIPGGDHLPVAALGDSDTLRPGQWVCAIGNPLGYVHSVTVGVVSFLGRKLFDQSLDAYIQTDAAISLGNSGGPLIDAQGRVVGITTAISSQAANIGFAVPISQVLPVLPQLRERGRVSRGYVGVSLTANSAALQRALGLPSSRGALVQDVTPETPADRAGLRAYDVIVSVDDVDVVSDEDLTRQIAGRAPGTTTTLGLLRGAERRAILVKLSERPLPEANRRTSRASDAQTAAARLMGPLGVTVRDLDRATAMRQSIPDTIQGVLVVDVDAAGPARLARVRTGHIVLEINRRRVTSHGEFQSVVASLKPGEPAAVLVYDQLLDQRVVVVIVPDDLS